MLQFFIKLKLYTKLPPETVQSVFLSNLFVTSCISSSSSKELFTKECHTDGSLVKLIGLSENTPVRFIDFLSSVIAIFHTVSCILWWL